MRDTCNCPHTANCGTGLSLCTCESPHHNGDIGTALRKKARGCDRGQCCGCQMSVLRTSSAREEIHQDNSTLHKGTQTKTASLPLPSPGEKKKECWGRGVGKGVREEDTGRRVGVRGQARSGKETCLAAEKPNASLGMRTVMSGRETLTRC